MDMVNVVLYGSVYLAGSVSWLNVGCRRPALVLYPHTVFIIWTMWTLTVHGSVMVMMTAP